MRLTRLALAFLFAISITAICAISCGKGGGRYGAIGSISDSALTNQSVNNTARTLSIEKAIEEVKAYEPPADEASSLGLDPQVFEQLRDELVRSLEARRDRGVSTLPTRDESGGGRDDPIDINDVLVTPLPT